MNFFNNVLQNCDIILKYCTTINKETTHKDYYYYPDCWVFIQI